MNVTRANGVQLHFAVEGASDKPVIVFSNSLGTDFRVWDRLAGRLAGNAAWCDTTSAGTACRKLRRGLGVWTTMSAT